MKLVVGLGNPGARYEGTRHNAGFLVVERFARDHGIPLDEEAFEGRFGRGFVSGGAKSSTHAESSTHEVGVLEPRTFMNLSGESVVAALRALEVEAGDLVVVYDDVDLPFGRLRLRPSGGTGGHRGMESIVGLLGHGEFARLRFGVGRPEDGGETADWVLSPFRPDEQRALPAHVARAAEAVEACLLDGVRPAMNRFNRDANAA